MTIFIPRGEDGCELAHPVDSSGFETFSSQINGLSRREGWTPVRMRLVMEEEHGEPLRESDAPWLGSHALIFRQKAVAALESLLLAHGELLPLECEQAKLAVFNPVNVLDALDEAASIVQRLPSSGRVAWIEKHVFRREVIQGFQVFKIKSLRVSPTFVGEQFVEQWRSAGLRGLTFEQVWEG
jgi:hypothetical protein